MPNTKEKIKLIAKEIIFTDFSISYKISIEHEEDISGIPFCTENINNKDLILNPTLINKENNIIHFVVINVTPHFYKDILDKTIRGFEEYKNEIKHIYQVGEVVGYLLKD